MHGATIYAMYDLATLARQLENAILYGTIIAVHMPLPHVEDVRKSCCGLGRYCRLAIRSAVPHEHLRPARSIAPSSSSSDSRLRPQACAVCFRAKVWLSW